jgi:hypothetical protein
MDSHFRKILNQNLVNATLQGDYNTIERLISLGGTIVNENPSFNEEKDALFMALIQQDYSLLQFLFDTTQKYNQVATTNQEEAYLNVLNLHDDVKALDMMEKEGYIEKNNCFLTSAQYLAPQCLKYVLTNHTKISDNTGGYLLSIFSDSFYLHHLDNGQGDNAKKWTIEKHLSILQIFYHYNPDLFQNMLLTTLAGFIGNPSFHRFLKKDYDNTNPQYLANYFQFGLKLEKPFKDYSIQPCTEFDSLALREHIKRQAKNFEHYSLADFITHEALKIKLQKLELESILTKSTNSPTKHIKI